MRYTHPHHDAGAGSDPGLLAALGLSGPAPSVARPGAGVAGDVCPSPMGSNPYQADAQWLADRCGKLTGSKVALLYGKAGKEHKVWSDASVTYAWQLVAERMCDANMRHFVTPAMEFGTKAEPEARQAFEKVVGKRVQLVGFVPHPTIENFGASPDGLVDDDAVFESKSPTMPKFARWKAAGAVPEEHIKQLVAEVASTRRPRAHFWAYDPRVGVPAHRYLHRIYEPTAEEVEEMEDRASRFLAFVDDLFDRATTA